MATGSRYRSRRIEMILQARGELWPRCSRDLRHAPEKVWQALTDPASLHEWAPYEADRDLGTAGSTVKLTTVGAPAPQVSETKVRRAHAPKVLEYNWGQQDIRWGLAHLLRRARSASRRSSDRTQVGMETMAFSGWQRLNAEYAKEFGVEVPSWRPSA